MKWKNAILLLLRRIWCHKQEKIYREGGKREKSWKRELLTPISYLFILPHMRIRHLFLKALSLSLRSAYRGLKAIGDEGQWGPPP